MYAPTGSAGIPQIPYSSNVPTTVQGLEHIAGASILAGFLDLPLCSNWCIKWLVVWCKWPPCCIIWSPCAADANPECGTLVTVTRVDPTKTARQKTEHMHAVITAVLTRRKHSQCMLDNGLGVSKVCVLFRSAQHPCDHMPLQGQTVAVKQQVHLQCAWLQAPPAQHLLLPRWHT